MPPRRARAAMHRTLLDSPHIGSYSAFLLLAFIAGWWMARRLAIAGGIAPRHVDNLTIICALAGLFGARLFSYFFYIPAGYDFWTAMTMRGGGMVFYGGLILGIVAVIIYSLVMRLNLRAIMDVFAAPAALGLALGRVGCFLAGCCWGDVCVAPAELAARNPHVSYQVQTLAALSPADFPLAVTFPKPAGAYEQHRDMHLLKAGATRSLPVHPVQLYEAALAFALAAYLYRAFRRRQWLGEICAKLVIGYALIRFATEFFRADNTPAYFSMTISQVISLVLAMLCLAVVLWGKRRSVEKTASAPMPSPVLNP
jgi:phosphatidylglycerol:prolipoprotein diacylglycerol transferase